MNIHLTTSEAIRATLGISEDSQELPDEVFINASLADEVELLMETWLETQASTSVAVVLATATSSVRTALTLCSKYTGALLLVPSLLTTTASKLSDGQDEFQRQPRDIEKLEADLNELLTRYKNIVLDSLGATANASPFYIMGKASPTFDPITG